MPKHGCVRVHSPANRFNSEKRRACELHGQKASPYVAEQGEPVKRLYPKPPRGKSLRAYAVAGSGVWVFDSDCSSSELQNKQKVWVNKMQENLKAKYGITDEEWKDVIKQVTVIKITNRAKLFLALNDLLKNGDIEGAASKDIIFRSLEHKQFYNEQLAKCRDKDSYHRALIYAAGICEDTRNHFSEIYDFSTRCIRWECLSAGWITGTSARILRLAFNLFTGATSENDEEGDYTVDALFGYSETKYLLQTLTLRYEC